MYKELMESEGKTVKMIMVNSSEDLTNGWNSIASGAEDVMIFSHSNDSTLILSEDRNDGYSTDGTNENMQPIGNIYQLTPKEIGTVTIFGCNAGHIDTAYSENDNVAQAILSLGGIDQVVAYDGNVAFGGLGALLEPFIDFFLPDHWVDFDHDARASNDQSGFFDVLKELYKERAAEYEREARGKVVYRPDEEPEILGW